MKTNELLNIQDLLTHCSHQHFYRIGHINALYWVFKGKPHELNNANRGNGGRGEGRRGHGCSTKAVSNNNV